MESPEASNDVWGTSSCGAQIEQNLTSSDHQAISSLVEEGTMMAPAINLVGSCGDVKPKGKTSRVSFKPDLEEEIWIEEPLRDRSRQDYSNSADDFGAMEEVPLLSNDKKSKAHQEDVEPLMQIDANLDKPTQIPIEVEKKFLISNDTEDKIRNLGGKFLKEVVCVDCYYDTPEYSLTLNDCWLRKRNGKWQLKFPPNERQKNANAAQYCETEAEEVIVVELCRKLRIDNPLGESAKNLEQVVSEYCDMFALLETHRKTYLLEGATIDLDFLDFGFQVGEIEVVIANRNELLDALNKIDYIALRLGLQSFATCNFSRWFPAVPMETTPR